MARNSIGSGFCSVYDPVEDLYKLIAKLTVNGNEEVETETSQGSPYLDIGVLTDYDEMDTARSLEIELEFEQLTANQIDLMLNRRGASNTFVHPAAKKVVMATTTVAMAGLTADQPCQLTELLSSAPGQRQFTQVDALGGPAASGEFSVDTDSLVFHASDVGAGKIAGLRYMTSSTKMVYGGPNAISGFDSVEIYVEQTHTKIARMAYYFPKVKLTSGAQFAIAAGGDAVTLTGKALIDSSKGFTDYFAAWEVA